MPAGKPSKYKKEYCDALIEHQKKGLSYETFGASIGVAKQSCDRWVKAHAEFRDAKKIASEECRLFWERMGIQGAAGKLKGFNTAAWIFNMKNRFQWRDRTPDEDKVDRRPVVIIRPSTGEKEVHTTEEEAS